MFIDSHCHLDKVDLTPYNGDFEAMLQAAHERGVSRMLCVSIDLDQFERMYGLVSGRDPVDLSVGVHPLHAHELKESALVTAEHLVALAKRPEIVALGETGLDYYYQSETVDVQKAAFIAHLQASCETRLPVIVHTRDARKDTLDIIREHGDPAVGGVLHCFTESWEMAEQALDMGYYISFSGIVTFHNAEALRNVVKRVPIERVLIETDAPYLAPVPFRGKKNEPQYVPEVAKMIADLKGLSQKDVACLTAENYRRLFYRR
ncbi:MAG: TatD family hydrolase [Marinobacterium sp.]|nr:TatD family hydrolase [Marinobacterium sp.]